MSKRFYAREKLKMLINEILDERERKHSELLGADASAALAEIMRVDKFLHTASPSEIQKLAEKGKEEDEYVCPTCNHTENRPFDSCPICNACLTWD